MLGIIGGTGLYQIEGLRIEKELTVETPYGTPSAPVVLGELEQLKVAFLPRHGVSHALLPSEINYRANIYALKMAGITRILSISATGSLREKIAPGTLVMPAQYIDLTRGSRKSSFFEKGLIAHICTAKPVCSCLVKSLVSTANEAGISLESDATYACVEGPRLGTRAESLMLQMLGGDVVGMTNVPEAFLAREAQICYASLCVVTDYDAWYEKVEEQSSIDVILKQYSKSLDLIKQLLKAYCAEPSNKYFEHVSCSCRTSLKTALLSKRSNLNDEHRQILDVLER